MSDDDFQYFLTKFPLTFSGPRPGDAQLRRFSTKLPNSLLYYWRDYGFSGFGNGLLWLIDPLEWESVANLLTDGIQHPSLGGGAEFIPVVRSAFGKIWLWSPNYGISLILNPVLGTAFYESARSGVDGDRLNRAIEAFFGASRASRFDMVDDQGSSLFDSGLTRLGELGLDELYGFVPAVRNGGAAVAENMSIFSAIPHLTVLREAIGDDWYTSKS